jgi:alkylation response protein AidB-like acyl-CoA dehydrogenase
MAIGRTLFDDDHRQYAAALDRFLAVEVAPHCERFEEQGCVERELWLRAAAAGFLCSSLPEEYGGAGADKLYSVILFEQLARNAVQKLLGWSLHSEGGKGVRLQSHSPLRRQIESSLAPFPCAAARRDRRRSSGRPARAGGQSG